VCCTGLTGVELFCGSRQVSPTGTCPTGGAHRPDQCRSVRLKFCVPLCSRVCEVGSWQHSSGCVGLANLGSKSETCVGSRVHLVGASISFEKNFYRLTFTPPSLVCRIGPSTIPPRRISSGSLHFSFPEEIDTLEYSWAKACGFTCERIV
jgi:hypothetical protein